MYLSQLVLNDHDRSVHREIGNAHSLHQRIMQAFPDQKPDNASPDWHPRQDWQILYRQEPDGFIILVQSAIEPDWSRLRPELFSRTPQVKPLDFSPAVLTVSKCFQFRLKANPSKRDKQTGKTIGYFKREDQLAWLERQASQHGFTVHQVDIAPTPNVFGKKDKHTAPIRIHTVLFQGILQITDPDLFLKALHQGIGRGRSYGCGLLSIAKLP